MTRVSKYRLVRSGLLFSQMPTCFLKTSHAFTCSEWRNPPVWNVIPSYWNSKIWRIYHGASRSVYMCSVLIQKYKKCTYLNSNKNINHLLWPRKSVDAHSQSSSIRTVHTRAVFFRYHTDRLEIVSWPPDTWSSEPIDSNRFHSSSADGSLSNIPLCRDFVATDLSHGAVIPYFMRRFH